MEQFLGVPPSLVADLLALKGDTVDNIPGAPGIGDKGARVKAIGAAAREELARVLGRKVHLFLHVKVAEDWSEKRDFYRLWGLEYDA